MKSASAIRAALVVLVTLGLLGLAPAANAGDDTMSQARAGRYYSKHACKIGTAEDRFSTILWRGRERVTTREVRRRLPQFKRESHRVGKAELAWASDLYNPPADWPSSVAGLVLKLADANTKHAGFRLRQGDVLNARQWLRLNGRSNRVRFGNYALKIRAKLDLPPSGEGC